jgi:mannan endo-1,6-alpha-mannosidase
VKFFSNGILWEPACETNFNCDPDQFCFKGFLAQYLALTTQLAPYTAAGIIPILESTATAAASFCNQGINGTQCTMWWTTTDGPPTLGVGQQMSALNVFNSNMFKFMDVGVDSSQSGGTSQGNPDAGAPASDQLLTYYSYFRLRRIWLTCFRIPPATTGDKALAGILTALFSVGGVGFAAWLAM